MNPQERTDRHPVRELCVLKEPRGRSLILSLACNIVICGRVRRRKPFVNVLFYLCPWYEDSVSTMHVRHVTSQTHHFLYIIRHLLYSDVGFVSAYTDEWLV
jgi:hypothetical protein